MDEKLLNHIRSSAREKPATCELPPEMADLILSKVAARFVSDPKRTWWWESIRLPSRRIDYGDTDILSEIEEAVGGDEDVYLVVTNDDPPPWPVFKGPLHEIVSLIGDQYYFEYFLTPASGDSLRWVIFDTHANDVIIVGEANEILDRLSARQGPQ